VEDDNAGNITDNKNEGDNDDNEEATAFTAQAHVDFFENTLDFYNLELADRVVLSIADNCSVNKKIAEILNVPHVNCHSHLLASEVGLMAKEDSNGANSLGAIVTSVATTMLKAEQSLKNCAVLRKLAYLAPKLNNKIRWSSIADMLKRFLRIRTELIDAAAHVDSTLEVNETAHFKSKCEKYEGMMGTVNTATLAMQE
jgi:hypothetical protein